jgi:peptide deformylase
MNELYVEFLKKAQRVATEVPSLTFIGNPILDTQTTFSSFEEAEMVCKKLEEALVTIRRSTGVGRGLAAPQIGSSERCFVTFVNDAFQYYINPSLVSVSSTTNWYHETCLSCGPVCCDMERPNSVTLSFIDNEGIQKEEMFDGFLARLLQHEYDHVEGVVNIRKAKPLDVAIVMSDPLGEKLREKKYE